MVKAISDKTDIVPQAAAGEAFTGALHTDLDREALLEMLEQKFPDRRIAVYGLKSEASKNRTLFVFVQEAKGNTEIYYYHLPFAKLDREGAGLAEAVTAAKALDDKLPIATSKGGLGKIIANLIHGVDMPSSFTKTEAADIELIVESKPRF